MKNPFTPNFGQVPLYMAGRKFLLGEIERALENGPGDPALSSILVGARGAGKTALLSHLSSKAQQTGWISVDVPCLPGMLQDILEQTRRKAREFLDERDQKHITGLTVGQIIGVEWSEDVPPSQNWRSAMTDLLEVLNAKGIGLYVTIDEIDPALDEMIQFAAIYQLFVREGRKVGLLMAGLPYKVSSLLRDESVSFLRRSSQYKVGRIDDEEIASAFKATVEIGGSTILDEVLERAVKEIDGFPFMMQLVGFRSWEERSASNDITMESVERGTYMAQRDMRNRILRPTLDELSDMDIKFLLAMLEDEDSSLSEEIAMRLNKTASYVTTYRKRLLDQGVIEMQGRARVRIALPGVREYLSEYLA